MCDCMKVCVCRFGKQREQKYMMLMCRRILLLEISLRKHLTVNLTANAISPIDTKCHALKKLESPGSVQHLFQTYEKCTTPPVEMAGSIAPQRERKQVERHLCPL